jgi:hypothetical protein
MFLMPFYSAWSCQYNLDLRLISSIFLRLSYRSFDALVSVFLMYSLNSTGHESKRFIFKLDAA